MKTSFNLFTFIKTCYYPPMVIMLLVLGALFFPLNACATTTNTADQQANSYINQHQHMAVAEMKRSGVPASIKLAQAMLETGFGTSRLAIVGRNHFGIKCKSYWVGDTLLVDDDAPQECFRKYPTVNESYRDHSEFLQFHRNGYYSHLFQLSRTDYVGWAIGLQTAGYATNSSYANKLIDLITRYQLYQYDYTETAFVTPVLVPTTKRNTTPPATPIASKTAVNTQTNTFVVPANPAGADIYPPLSDVAALPITRIKVEPVNEPAAASKKSKKNAKNKPIADFNAAATTSSPQPPPTNKQNGKPISDFNASMTTPVTVAPDAPATETNSKVIALTLRRQIINGVKAVVPNIETDLATVAAQMGINAQKIYTYNETAVNRKVNAQVPIFLAAKKGKSPKGLDRHIVQPNQTMYEIAQLYGIKQKNLLKVNNLPHNFVPREGMVLKLR